MNKSEITYFIEDVLIEAIKSDIRLFISESENIEYIKKKNILNTLDSINYINEHSIPFILKEILPLLEEEIPFTDLNDYIKQNADALADIHLKIKLKKRGLSDSEIHKMLYSTRISKTNDSIARLGKQIEDIKSFLTTSGAKKVTSPVDVNIIKNNRSKLKELIKELNDKKRYLKEINSEKNITLKEVHKNLNRKRNAILDAKRLAEKPAPKDPVEEIQNKINAKKDQIIQRYKDILNKLGYDKPSDALRQPKTKKVIDAVLEYSKKAGKIVGYTLLVAGVSAVAIKTYRRMEKDCEKYKDKNKTTYNKCRLRAIDRVIYGLKKDKKKCSQTNEPDLCIKKINEQIKKWENKADTIKRGL